MGYSPTPKYFRPAYAGIRISKERSPDTIRTPFFSFCRFAPALSRFALRYLVQRLVRDHALRLHEFAAEGQARADIRMRIRGIVKRTALETLKASSILTPARRIRPCPTITPTPFVGAGTATSQKGKSSWRSSFPKMSCVLRASYFGASKMFKMSTSKRIVPYMANSSKMINIKMLTLMKRTGA